MKEAYEIIRYKWQCGVYDLPQMIQMVKDGIINEDQFFDITRYHYKGVTNELSS